MESNNSDSHEPADITELEVRILELLAGGLTNKEIEQQLELRHQWLNNNLSRIIYKKLGVKNRFDAVAEARARGLVGQPEISLQEALDIGRQASRIILNKQTMTPRELAIVNRYRTLSPYMAGQINSPDQKQSLAGLAFTFSDHGRLFAELSKQARSLSPRVYGRIGLAAKAVADKSSRLSSEYQRQFEQESD